MQLHSLLFPVCVLAEHTQQAFLSSPGPKVAIIGAGAGGAACSYYLSSATEADITIYEKNDYIGGRSNVVYVHDDPLYPAPRFNLSFSDFDLDPITGIWDGQKFSFTLDIHEPSWKTAIRLLLKYGTSPITVKNHVKKVISTFLKLYDAPFASLTLAAKFLALDSQTSVLANKYLSDLGVSGKFSHDIIQASTRCNYAQNLDQLQALTMMVCMTSSNVMSIKGGNRLIFENMIKASEANLKLETEVMKVEKEGDKWSVDGELYDHVVIATPIKQSRLSLPANIEFPEIEYVELYVTLVSTRYSLNTSTFGKSPPNFILTTTSSSTPWFNSLSVVQSYLDELVWKIFSLEEVTDVRLDELFSGEITWIYQHKWEAYPKLRPRSDFGKIEVEKGLWWINGMEGFISTMETSALMGRNIAALIANKTSL
ncbi:Farnesylcysteine lyase [Neolecta irregularis DAH-3]|uniref:Farnesylcysteine lyase n=1 Tax=Neolecta irregularis (strain DAH-3) TaxID=1198029 RepID=A0A1U7LUF0_NEOID|nr:Farnesylcysteine lyase [Neolecta irregularis DAH-3]|eukprot:OLL26141.1 Farnesylcysteine lyase [Neolecta irregularis DAH-3]